MNRKFLIVNFIFCFCTLQSLLVAQTFSVTVPKEHFGFNIGDSYHLANFTQTEAYFKKLASESPRVKYQVIGKTEEVRDQCMLIVSSPENLQNLAEYQTISRDLAGARMDEAKARELSEKGKAVVWIDGGLHSSETVAMHQLIELAYQLSSSTNQEVLHILDNTIVLLVHANPDGQEMVGDWYMRESVPEKRSLSNRPVLYQKYAGHDNNRDFFMLNLKESQNIARQLFIEWIPQIMYNHHQSAPAGAVVAGAPYRDPFNYVFDPLLMSSIDALGAAMSSRLNVENKPGYTSKGGSVFSTWYNGGLRTTTYFHNIVGLLSEVIGSPNPSEVPLVTRRLLPSSDTQNPIVPQQWLFQYSIDYSMSLNYAVLNYASRHRSELLFNIYRMGRNSIERGSKDYWALSPSKVAVIDSAVAHAKREDPKLEKSRSMPGSLAASLFGNPQYRDPRGYIISRDQKDFATATRFVNALIGTGIAVQVAEADFEVNGKSYGKGSYIVKTNQAFRPHVIDMFEPQDHPNDFQYPGGPPIVPYDAAGWTPAYLMHVDFDRIMEDFNGPFANQSLGEEISFETVKPTPSKYLKVSASQNEAYKLVNQQFNAKRKVWRDVSNGDWYIANNNLSVTPTLAYESVDKMSRNIKELKPLRIALLDIYGGNMPSGWIRYTLEQFDYPFTVIYPPQIDAGNLHDLYDVIIFPNNTLSRINNKGSRNVPKDIPSPYRENWGDVSAHTSVPVLKEFVEKGGRIIAIGSSSVLASQFGLSVENALKDEKGVSLGRETFYTPGSVLQAKVQTGEEATRGYAEYMDIYFSNDSVFKINGGGVTPLLWFDSETPLRSGWSWGQKYLKDGIIAFESDYGKGKLAVFSTDITFRSQAHGTFKLLFNQLYH